MAEAMAEVLRHRSLNEPGVNKKPSIFGSLIKQNKPIEEDKVTYIPIREINLDDNGLKD